RSMLTVVVCGILLVLGSVNVPSAQEPAPDKQPKAKKGEALLQPDTLERLVADAAKNHPDVKVAEARVQLEQAKLEQTRAHLKAQIAIAFADAEAARAANKEGHNRWIRALDLRNRKAISEEDYGAALLTKIKLQADAVSAEMRLQALVGRPI